MPARPVDPARVEFVKANAGKLSDIAMGAQLGCHANAIRRIRVKYKIAAIAFTPGNSLWSEEAVAILKHEYAQKGTPPAKVAAMLGEGFTPASIRRKAARMGLVRNRAAVLRNQAEAGRIRAAARRRAKPAPQPKPKFMPAPRPVVVKAPAAAKPLDLSRAPIIFAAPRPVAAKDVPSRILAVLAERSASTMLLATLLDVKESAIASNLSVLRYEGRVCVGEGSERSRLWSLALEMAA